MIQSPSNSPLGNSSAYIDQYDPSLLFAISRQAKRDEIGISKLPFTGYDIWNAYEVSWLNIKGKPMVAIGEFVVPCDSPNIFESKSAKLYLNSFNNTRFDSKEQVQAIIAKDLSKTAGAEVEVWLSKLAQAKPYLHLGFDALLLDEQDIKCDVYQTSPEFLSVSEQIIEETVYSDLLKSNCLVTNQPDWGSVYIKYRGKKIDHAGLLRYIVSFRNHNEFHEQCVERMFQDILSRCQPVQLTIYARYTRRGGLDINPLRTNCGESMTNLRLIRQ